MCVCVFVRFGFLFILCIVCVCLYVYVMHIAPPHAGGKVEHLVSCSITLHHTPLRQGLSLGCLLTIWSIFSPSDTDQGLSNIFVWPVRYE